MNIIQQNYQHIESLAAEFDLTYLALFGSHARDKATENSDVDILVDYDQPLGLLAFSRLERKLSEVLGKTVDLVSKKGLSKHLKPFVDEDLQVIYEKK